ncbi:hypothetical protein [Paraglaciecola sp. 25GB23A]|uniref:hypothetical protein n=1 Tax=Paraglaciecola sp. 25GB23A TaxID=3156068 RepID=UPI0032AFC2AB
MTSRLISSVSSASAEAYIKRSGKFAIPIPTSEFDGIGDFFESFGDLIVLGVKYLSEKTFNAMLGMTELLLTGNPIALFDEFNLVFE